MDLRDAGVELAGELRETWASEYPGRDYDVLGQEAGVTRPDDVPAGTPGRSPNGARLLDATFTVDNVFTNAPGDTVWKAITTPWAGGTPNAAGTVETRALVERCVVDAVQCCVESVIESVKRPTLSTETDALMASPGTTG